jgi:transcription initiation factor IIE alpha subunit
LELLQEFDKSSVVKEYKQEIEKLKEENEKIRKSNHREIGYRES